MFLLVIVSVVTNMSVLPFLSSLPLPLVSLGTDINTTKNEIYYRPTPRASTLE